MTALTDREINLHSARVYLREARARQSCDPHFAAILRGWAANARRRAASVDVLPAQGSLFA